MSAVWVGQGNLKVPTQLQTQLTPLRYHNSEGAGQGDASGSGAAAAGDAKATGEGGESTVGDVKKMASAADLRSHLSKIKRRAGATWVFDFDVEGKSVDAKAEAEKRGGGGGGGAVASKGGDGAKGGKDASQKGESDLSTLGGFEDAFNKTTSMREGGKERR